MAATQAANHLHSTRMALERFWLVKWREAEDIDLRAYRRLPYPGHMILFEMSLYRARRIAERVGGLKSFAVKDYADGQMNIRAEMVRPGRGQEHKRASDDLLAVISDAALESRSTCVLCGRDKARAASRFVPEQWRLPLCTRQIHDDSAMEELLHPSLTLNEAKKNLQQRLRERRAVGIADDWEQQRSLGEIEHQPLLLDVQAVKLLSALYKSAGYVR